MGYCKNKLIEWDERGYKSIDTVVCERCIGDYALKKYINENGSKEKCSYCGKIGICDDLENVIGQIVEGVKAEFSDANNCMMWDHKEGGFCGAKVYDNYDLIYEVLNGEMQIDDNSILKDIIKTLNDSITWCKRNPYNLRIHEEDYIEWENLCNYIKKNNASVLDIDYVYKILSNICMYIEDLGLVITKNIDSGFYRSRAHKSNEIYNTAKDIGSPPEYYSEENRMSPKGTSMFYGAEDIKTTLAEIDKSKAKIITTAKFYPTKPIRVIDFTRLKLIEFPSLFDNERRNQRSPLIFLSKVADDISKPINSNKKIEYLPTQIFTKYLKNIYKSCGNNIDGIIYESSKNYNGKCCALFFNNHECTDSRNEKLKKLWMDKSSIKRINVK